VTATVKYRVYYETATRHKQKILLDCDQSNVLLAHIIFSCILQSAFSFPSTCLRDPTRRQFEIGLILY